MLSVVYFADIVNNHQLNYGKCKLFPFCNVRRLCSYIVHKPHEKTETKTNTPDELMVHCSNS